MPATKIFKHIHHTPDNLLAMVADVETYPQFIELLSKTRVSKKRKLSASEIEFEADVIVSYKFLNETFRSLVKVYLDKKKIVVKKPDRSGAVKTLSNIWVFHRLSDGSTLVEFDVDVRLKALPLEILVRDKFDKAANYIMQRFEARADHLYSRLVKTDLDMSAELTAIGLPQMQL